MRKKRTLLRFPRGSMAKILLRVKLLTACMLCVMVVSAADNYSQATKFNFRLNNATVRQVFKTIEESSEFIVIYNEKSVDVNRKVDVKVKNETIESVLNQVFEGTNNEYKIYDRQIVVLENENAPIQSVKQPELFDSETVQSKKDISGKVTDNDGAPVPGATVVVKGTTIGTTTDNDGNFSLRIPIDAETLQFSFVGMKTQEIPIGGQSVFNIKMESETIGLDEVVAVGYGTMKKSDITGSVGSVAMDFAKNQPFRGTADLMAGRVAGVTLTRASGDISASTKIRIRGANSLNGSNSPLTVVDGVIGGSAGPAQDIESIEILKDASATAIYGERASNGVILITTKRATTSEPKINVSLNTSLNIQKTNYKDLMTAAEYAEHVNDLNQTTVYSSSEIEEFRKTGGTDWLDAINRNALSNNHYISYSQKINKLSVFMSAKYGDKQGTMINSKAGGNYSVRSSIGFQPNDRLKMDLDVRASMSQTENGGLSTGTSKAHPFFQALVWSPTEEIWDDEEAGEYNEYDSYGSLAMNPYETAMEQDNWAKSTNTNVRLNANYKILDCLSYDVTGYISKSASESGSYSNALLSGDDPSATRSSGYTTAWRLINKIDFHKTFLDAHNVNVTGVYETESSESWSLSGTGKDMPLPDLATYYDIEMSNEQSTSSGYGLSTRLAYLARLNYNFKSRYYLTASYRVDGKSGPENRLEENKYGAFPSFSVSWRASEESFMKANGFFDNLKLRAGWGQTGNPCTTSYTTMKSNNFDYGVGSDIMGYIPGTPANPYLKWETTTQINVGLDFTILDGRLSFSADYFDKKTEDLMTEMVLPLYYGYGDEASYLQNLGEITNKGFEFTIDYTPIQTRNFIWQTNFNFSKVKNEIVDLGDQSAFMAGTNGNGYLSVKTYRIDEGLPLGTMWGYKCLGIWQESEETEAAVYGLAPGDYKYEDVNNDGAINLDDDGQAIGDANPSFTWGWNNNFSYKNFDLNITLMGMHGQDVYNLARACMSTVHADSRTIMLKGPATDYWTEDNPDAEFKNIHSTSDTKVLNSTTWIEDGSWIKVKYIGLTYHLPKDLIKIGELAVSLSAEELWTITKYKGLDPEVSASTTSDEWGGCDFGTQPIPTAITFGVSLDF